MAPRTTHPGAASRGGRGTLVVVTPFTYKFGQDPWPEDLTLLHAYVLPHVPRAPGLAALVGACRDATRGEPLAHIPDEWLHITLCQIAVPARQVGEAARAALVAALGERLAAVPSFTVTVGTPLGVPSGVLLGIADGLGRLEQVRGLVTSAVAGALGPGTPLASHTWPVHLTESYAYGAADDERVQAALEGVSPREAPLSVGAVDLVDVSVNQATKGISWKPVARIPLAAGQP